MWLHSLEWKWNWKNISRKEQERHLILRSFPSKCRRHGEEKISTIIKLCRARREKLNKEDDSAWILQRQKSPARRRYTRINDIFTCSLFNVKPQRGIWRSFRSLKRLKLLGSESWKIQHGMLNHWNWKLSKISSISKYSWFSSQLYPNYRILSGQGLQLILRFLQMGLYFREGIF